MQQGASTKPWPFSSEVLAQQLAETGAVARPVLDALAREAQSANRSLPALLVERRQMTAEAVRDAMSRAFRLPVANLGAISIDPDLVANFPSEAARTHMFLPLHREDTRLIMVVADPTQSEAIRAVRRALGLTIDMRLAAPNDLAPIVHQYFSPTLVVLLPSGETMTIPVSDGEIKIGKAEHNELVLPDPTVSSTHAILRAHGSDYQIVDFGSRNGIYVDNVRVSGSQALKNGDVITIGQCLLTFKLPVPEASHGDDGGTRILSPAQLHAPARPTPVVGMSSASIGAAAAGQGGGAPAPNMMSSAAAGGMAGAAAGDVAAADAGDDEKGGKKKKKKKDKAKDADKLKSAWIGFVGRIIAQIVGALATIVLGLAVAGKLPTSCMTSGGSRPAEPPPGTSLVTPTAFGETNPTTKIEYNASGIVPIGDSRFLFCDNNTNDAMFELSVGPDGAKTGPIVRHPLVGLAPGTIDDMEGLTTASEEGARYVFATSSMSTKFKKNGLEETPPSGLVRIRVNPDNSLAAENMTGFREWLIANSPEVKDTATKEPDYGGINIEGLAWDAGRNALLLGVRTPLLSGKPFVLPVKLKSLSGPWDPSNLELLAPIRLDVPEGSAEQGIRAIEYDESRKAFLVILGNSTSASNAPFQMYLWNGSDAGSCRRVEGVWFAPKMKAEGVTHGTVGGKGAVVVLDDAGGFQVLFDDDPRVKM